MKTRNIPFGYTMENGKIIFHPTESQAVKDMSDCVSVDKKVYKKTV